MLLLILVFSFAKVFGQSQGGVDLSPSTVAFVCRIGAELKLTCTTSGMFLRWDLFNNASLTRRVSSAGSTSDTDPLMINSTTATFSRDSAEDVQPLKSTVTINPVTASLNGSTVMCVNVGTDNTSSTTIYIVDKSQSTRISLNLLSEDFSSDNIITVLNWTHTNPLPYHNNISVTVVPPLSPVFLTNTSIQLTVYYNTHYNVSATPTPCGEESETDHLELFYSKCMKLGTLIQERGVIADRYVNPALGGMNVSFSCPDGMALTGPNTTTCMENGEWEPDLSSLTCESFEDVTTVDCPSNSGDSTDPSCLDRESDSSQIVMIAVAVVFGVLLLIGIITVVVAVTLVKKRKGLKVYFTQRERSANNSGGQENEVPTNENHEDFEASGRTLVYACLGPSNQSDTRPVPLAICSDEMSVTYAQLNTDSLSVSQHQQPQTPTENKPRAPIPAVNLDSLLVQLRPAVSSKWYQFGEAVGVDKELLDNCNKSCLPENRFVEVLDLWLRRPNEERPTWKDVAKILRDIDLPQLATDIESVYITGKLPVEVDMVDSLQVSLLCSQNVTPPPPVPPKFSSCTLPAPMKLPYRQRGPPSFSQVNIPKAPSASQLDHDIFPPPIPMKSFKSPPPRPPKPKISTVSLPARFS